MEKTYTKPEQKLGTVTGAWEQDRPGVYSWNLVEGAVGYWAELPLVWPPFCVQDRERWTGFPYENRQACGILSVWRGKNPGRMEYRL
nr:hypothetical protein [uncultured Acetatifactor sp.]